jgi:pimeloyl-ACP methyl ester carboxylesterase
MFSMARALKRAGYERVYTPTFLYHSLPLAEAADRLVGRLTTLRDQHGDPFDLVTHSYGGILARVILPRAPVRRLVMLSPPNQGAELAELIRGRLPVHRLGWDPLAPLLPGVPSEHPDGPAEIGILTGGRGGPRGFSRMLNGDNDGKVRVDEAWLESARDFRVLPVRHPFIMMGREVQRMTVGFLREGRFPQ